MRAWGVLFAGGEFSRVRFFLDSTEGYNEV